MTDRAEIERLLNQTGRTLEGLPKDIGYLCSAEYLYDLVDLMIGALRDALNKPMQKPLTLEEVNKYDEPVWIEFKVFSSANGWREGISDVLYWVQKVYKDMSNPVMGVVYRLWRCKPTDEERSAAPWEN